MNGSRTSYGFWITWYTNIVSSELGRAANKQFRSKTIERFRVTSGPEDECRSNQFRSNRDRGVAHQETVNYRQVRSTIMNPSGSSGS